MHVEFPYDMTLQVRTRIASNSEDESLAGADDFSVGRRARERGGGGENVRINLRPGPGTRSPNSPPTIACGYTGFNVAQFAIPTKPTRINVPG